MAYRPLRPERQLINLGHLHLRGAFLIEANLTSALLTGADLTGADLTGADLRGALLFDANLTSASLTRAALRGAYLTDATILTGADLAGAKLGPDPRWVPSGWIVIDPKTGELWRPAGFLSAAWLTGSAHLP